MAIYLFETFSLHTPAVIKSILIVGIMTNDLFAREKEFRRVNRELDERTRHLLEEIDQVVNSETRNMFSPGIPDAFRPQLSMAFDKFYAEPPLDFDSDYHHNKIQDITQDENNCTSPAAGDQIKSTLYGLV